MRSSNFLMKINFILSKVNRKWCQPFLIEDKSKSNFINLPVISSYIPNFSILRSQTINPAIPSQFCMRVWKAFPFFIKTTLNERVNTPKSDCESISKVYSISRKLKWIIYIKNTSPIIIKTLFLIICIKFLNKLYPLALAKVLHF